MNAPQSLKDALQKLTDDPKLGCKVVAAQAGVDRKTLYNIMRNGIVSDRTIRKIQEKFSISPNSPQKEATTD